MYGAQGRIYLIAPALVIGYQRHTWHYSSSSLARARLMRHITGLLVSLMVRPREQSTWRQMRRLEVPRK